MERYSKRYGRFIEKQTHKRNQDMKNKEHGRPCSIKQAVDQLDLRPG
jgi:hypothetical protein